MRIKVVENGKVLPGQEEHFALLVAKEKAALMRMHDEMCELDLVFENAVENITYDWEQEARDSLIATSFRFGNGDLWVETEDQT